MTDLDRQLRDLAEATNDLAGLIAVLVIDGVDAMYWDGEMEHHLDDRTAQYPRVYRSLGAAEKCVARLNSRRINGERGKWTVAMWVHPDCSDLPMAKYLGMTGVRYLGSPRR